MDPLAVVKALKTAASGASFVRKAFSRHEDEIRRVFVRALLDLDYESRIDDVADLDARLIKFLDENEWGMDVIRCMFLEEESSKLWAYGLLVRARLDGRAKYFGQHLRFVRSASSEMLTTLQRCPPHIRGGPGPDTGITQRSGDHAWITEWKKELGQSLVQQLYLHAYVTQGPFAGEEEIHDPLPELLDLLEVPNHPRPTS